MINRISSVCSFQGNKKIIDSHVHLGKWYDDYFHPDRLLQYTGETERGQKVEGFFASTLDCLVKKDDGSYFKNEIDGNMDMIKDIKKYNAQGYIKPLLVCQPDSGKAQNIENLLKSGETFYGLKLHPMESHLSAESNLYEPYMKLAQKYNLTTVFHSGPADSFADPHKIYNLARRTPDVPTVLYHMSIVPGLQFKDIPQEERTRRGVKGTGEEWAWVEREKWNQDGIDVVKEALSKKDANLYLETSWTKPETIVKAIKEVGADRVLFGTDAPLGNEGQFANKTRYYQYVDSVQDAIRSEFKESADEVIEKVFYKNAEGLFKPQTIPPALNQTVSTVSRTNPGKIIGIAAGIIGTGIGLFALNRHLEANKVKNIQIPKQQLYKFTAYA